MVATMHPLPDQQVAIDKLKHVSARLIGDSMGVGKTVTAIGLDMEQRKLDQSIDDLPTLIIAEKIGLDVWDYHLKAMGVPEEEILVVDPTDREPFVAALEYEGRYQASKVKTPPKYVYYVVHWDALNKISALTERRTKTSKFAKVEFAHIIADEVHLAKNRKALRTLAFKRITGRYKTGCSGTPADDKPWDIWSILHWLYPKKFRSYWKFWDDYIQWVNVSEIDDWKEWSEAGGSYEDFRSHPNHIGGGNGYRIAVGVKNMDKLHRIMEPFYIRRTLLEINPDMPAKIHVDPPITVKMTGRMRREYDRMRDKAMALIGPDADFTLLAPQTIAVLTRLQQMALATLAPEWEVTINDYGDEEYDHPKIVLTKPSPKLDAVMDLVTTHEEEPFVIFTQFRGMADLVEEECQRLKIPVGKITGEVTSKDERTRIVKEFQEDGKTRVFVGTIAAAGRSITLTRAHIAIFIDRSWNPNKNAQAEDRLWRRTQKNAVRIYHIESQDSVDQIRLERIKQKGKWVDAINNPRKYAA
jgi:SNF2 family DNA or RNA helicase